MSLRSVNLNLLPILQMLLKTRSVTDAASTLGLSQPAVSDALSRLRDVLGDQLLVRIGGRMKLTPRAIDMIEPLELICADVEKFLRPDAFNPKNADREFVIATSDICAYLLARQMVELLREEAPGISLHLIDVERGLTTKMAAREIDFALLPDFAISDFDPAPLRFIPLLYSANALLTRRGHPLASKEPLTESDLGDYPLVIFQPDAVIKDSRRLSNPWVSESFKVVARVGQMLILPHLVIDSDSIAFVPQQFGDAMAAVYPLESRIVPFGLNPGNMGLAWSPVYDSDPAHKWFRTAMMARLRYEDHPRN